MTILITRLSKLLVFKRAKAGGPTFARGSAVERFTLGVLLALAGLVNAAPAGAKSMEGLGFLSDYPYSYATGVSADGSTVVGGSGDEAFVWTNLSGTMMGLGFIPGAASPFSVATGVSADGSTAVGYGYSADFNIEAFVWTATSGTMTGLGFLAGAAYPYSSAKGVSADGSTVVGNGYNADGNVEAFVWTAGAGMTGLGALPGAAYPFSYATGVSADGSTVVGNGANAFGNNEGFVWTAGAGITGLGFLPGALYPESYANGISADGSTVVGQSVNSDGNTEAIVFELPTAEEQQIADLKLSVQALAAGGAPLPANGKSLLAKLDAAAAALGRDVVPAAIGSLNAFINQVESFSQSGKLTPDKGQSLIEEALIIVIDLGG